MMTRTQTATETARTYAVDKTHSEVTFQVRHLLTKVRGRFSDFAGTVHMDEEDPRNSSVSLTIEAASIDTANNDRDGHLRSDDFFAVDTYPTLTFKSSRIVRTSDDIYEVTGTLTIRGVAREIMLPVTYLGTAQDPWGSARAGFETEITINRKDFGLLWNAALETGGFLVGDEVRISASVQAIAGPEGR
jgi:polyisoprenoid-binding protein YceI